MIIIKNLNKKYENKQVLKKVNIEIEDGDIFAFVGSNGAGKTTTIKCMTGIIPFDSGDILFNGKSIKNDEIEIKKQIAYIPDNPDIYEYLTGIEYINFVCDIYEVDKSKRLSKIKELAKMLELDKNLNDKISTYSHGMRQKLVIISALVHDPKYIIMDEPFVGLDPVSTHKLKNIMNEITKEGKIIFFSTHVLDVAEKLCNKVAVIKNGEILFNGKMDELTKNSSLEDIFMELVSNE